MSIGFVAIYVLAQFGIWVALLTPVVLTLAIRVGDIASEAEKGRWLGMILAIGGFVTLVATPLCGALSDRTSQTARLSRRHAGGSRLPDDRARPFSAGIYLTGMVFALLGAFAICPVRRSR